VASAKRKYYQQVMEEHRQRLLRLSMRRGVFPLSRMYHEAAIEQEAKLRAQLGSGANTFTTHQMRFVLAQITDGQATLSAKMAAELGSVTREAQKEAVSGLLKDVGRLEKKFTGATIELPLEEASRFYGIIDKRKTSLLRMHQSSMAKHGAQTVKAVERELAMSLLTGENQDQAIGRVLPAIEGEWWQAERIVRTEVAHAYNASHRDAIEDTARDVGGMKMQWEEMVDEDGNPYDDRVAIDSLAMHGQVAGVGEMFYMPPATPKGEAIPESLQGQEWAFPPNRPNDRAVVSPWKRDWGIPGWVWRNGKRATAL